jgi:hypothetical protein
MSSSTDSETRQRGRVKDRLDPSTSQGGTPSQPLANTPEPVIDDDFGDWTFPKVGSSDAKIQKFLFLVFVDVKLALKKDKDLKSQLAGDVEFFDNVNRRGEWNFINSLKSMTESRAWTSLLKDGTLFILRFRSTLIEFRA